ncbi:hypothetical protein BYT27DRAFT_7293622 [Phlegmacium glaucopus]|nr:hypothetical protein BYT27DRAFT_7293622 [Phlegmacium glaucopus]
MLFYLLLHTFLLFSVQVSALPILPRQAAAQPSSVTTVQTINSGSGAVTQTCVIVLTPIKDDQGNDAVREVKTCTVAMAVPNPIGSGTNPPSVSASQPTPSPSTVLLPAPVPTFSSINPTPPSPVVTVVTSPSAITTTLLASTSASSASSSAIPVPSSASAVPLSAPAVPSSASSVPASVAPSSTPIGANVNSRSLNGASSVPAPAAPTNVESTRSKSPSVAATLATSTGSASGSAAAEQATATTSAFTLPGKKLSVLPIGLGVFAGISVIALIIVGLVTYERTKYRKAFRQRRLAENGAAMSYGGNMV